MDQKIAIVRVVSAIEKEPAIFEIKVELEDGAAILRLNAFTLRSLAEALKPHLAV